MSIVEACLWSALSALALLAVLAYMPGGEG